MSRPAESSDTDFDVSKPLAGTAGWLDDRFGVARPLPQLPLAVDAQGYLVAKSDFTQPVGPSFWERG